MNTSLQETRTQFSKAVADSGTPFSNSSASKPVSIAILGANFGAKLARQLVVAAGPVRVIGVCDLDTAKASALAVELGVPFYPNLDELLADPAIEAVGLFTGPSGRAKLIERIVAAGKHVMTTKPFELDAKSAEQAYSAAARYGRVLHLNSPAPVPAADLAFIRRWMADGSLGRPVSLHARTWADYNERADGTWYDDPLRCPGGPLFRLGVYFLSDFAGLMGKPVEVHVTHTRLRTGRPTPDNAQMAILYDNGALASIFASFCIGDGQPYRDEVVIACERGTIRRWMVREGGDDMDSDRAVVELQRAGHPVERIITEPGDYAGWYGWEAFHAAVRGLPGSVRADEAGTIASVRLLVALSEAANNGGKIKL
jgi:predicted dehydrogenase